MEHKSKRKLGKFNKKMLALGLSLLFVLSVGIVAVLAATSQKAGISTTISYKANNVAVRIYFDVYHQSGDTKTTLVPKQGTNALPTETADNGYQGMYYLDIDSYDASNPKVSFDPVNLVEVVSTLPDTSNRANKNIYTGYVNYNFTIVNKGSRDVLVTVDENEINTLDNLVVDKQFNLGTGRSPASSSSFTILNANYATNNGSLPASNTGTADTSATVSMQVFVEDPALNANGNYEIPLILRAQDYEPTELSMVSNIEISAAEDIKVASGSKLNAYINDNTTPYATYNLANGQLVTNTNNFQNYSASDMSATGIAKSIDVYLPNDVIIYTLTLETILINESDTGIFVSYASQGTSQNLDKTINLNSNNNTVANKSGNTIDSRTCTYKESYKKDNVGFSQVVLNMNVSKISEVSASHDFTYTLTEDGKGYKVSKGATEPTGVVILPNYYNGILVTEIAENGFSYLSNVTAFLIPNGITTIGKSAFEYSSCITQMDFFNETLTNIEDHAFYGVSGVSQFTIQKSVANIGIGVFIMGPVKITVDSSNTNFSVENSCLLDLSTQTLLCLADQSVTSISGTPCTAIADEAFLGAVNLNSVYISEGVQTIGKQAFYASSISGNITIPSSMKKIGQEAFSYCSSISSITFENSIGWLQNGTYFQTAYENENATNMTKAGFGELTYAG